MVVGVGIDICENDRISEMLGKYRDRFLNRVFTPEEVSCCLKKKDPIPHLAARFGQRGFLQRRSVCAAIWRNYQRTVMSA